MLMVVVLVLLLPLVVCQGGGMAELKSITGDEPYSGVGNAPATIPRPMGFWGRPRFVYRHIDLLLACTDRVIWVVPDAVLTVRMVLMDQDVTQALVTVLMAWVDGPLTFDDTLDNAVMGSFSPSPYQPYYPRRSAVHSSITQPFQSSFPRASPGSFGSFGSDRASRFNPFSVPSVSSPTVSTSSASLSQSTGGGFYQGKGNEMVGR